MSHKDYRSEKDCLNCGTELTTGNFCPECGQENLQLKENFFHFITHTVADYFHFDSKFFHTLKPLLLQPGLLTLEYMKGKRTKFLHPVRMYIFISIVFFILLSRNEKKHERENIQKARIEALTDKDSAALKALKKKHTDGSLEAKINKVVDKSVNKVVAKYGNEKADTTVAETTSVKQAALGKAPIDSNKLADADDDEGYAAFEKGFIYATESKKKTAEDYEKEELQKPADERDSPTNHFLKKQYYEVGGGKALIKEIQHNLPKMMFILLPMFAFILRLFFYRSKKFYMEHLIYSFHLHSFFFLFFSFIIILEIFIPALKSSGLLSAFITLATIWYIYRSLRVLYQRSRWRTISKMIGLFFSYTMILTLSLVLLALATLAVA